MSKVKYETSAQQEWDARTSLVDSSSEVDVPFGGILKDILPIDKKRTCLEIGAIPGKFLVFMNNTFGYKVIGIDFSKNDHKFTETMKANKIKNYSFINKDFFKHKFTNKFGVVSSFGFIEHFDDLEDVLKRHCDLVEPGGYLVLEVPNFRGLQYVYHRIFDRKNLAIHNLDAMKLSLQKKIVESNGLKTIYSAPVGNAEFWSEDELKSYKLSRIRDIVTSFFNKIGRIIPANRLTSPYLLAIYRREA